LTYGLLAIYSSLMDDFYSLGRTSLLF